MSYTISQSLLKFMSIESVMLSNHLGVNHSYYLSNAFCVREHGAKRFMYVISFNPQPSKEVKSCCYRYSTPE